MSSEDTIPSSFPIKQKHLARQKLKTTKLLCWDCLKEGKARPDCMIEDKNFFPHIKMWHEAKIRHDVASLIKHMEPKIIYILTHDKLAKSFPSRVLELYDRLWPFKSNSNYQIIYDATDQMIELPRKMTVTDFDEWIVHVESVNRIERGMRARLGIKGSRRKTIHRMIKADQSRQTWGMEKMANLAAREENW